MPAFFVQTSLKATLVLVAAWLLTRAMKRSSAAARHFVWTVAVVAALALPLVQLVAPRWNLLLPASPANPAVTALAEAWSAPGSPMYMPGAPDVAEPAATQASTASPDQDPTLAPTVEIGWIAVAMAIWVGGVAVALARLAAGLAWVSRITREAVEVDDLRWTEQFDTLAAALGITTPVSMKVSPEATIPVTCGIRRPTILLPVDATEWPDERRDVVLRHELAHVARRDCLVQTLARLACAVHWFNPLAYLAAAEQRAEQERATDDLVLASGTAAPVYADHLFELARTARTERDAAWATLAMARPSQIEGRVIDILDDQRNRRPPGRAVRAAVAVVATALLVPLSALQLAAAPEPQSVPAMPAFEAQFDPPPPIPDSNPAPLPNPRPSPQVQAQSRPQGAAVSDDTRRRVADALLSALNDQDEDVREQALAALAGMRDPRAIPGLLKASRDSSVDVREEAIDALAQFDTPEAIEGLMAALKDQSPEVRERAARAIGALGARGRLNDPKYAAVIVGLLKDPAADVRMQAIAALVRMRQPSAVPSLIAMLKDMDPGVREQAADALGDLGDPAAIDALTAALKDAEPEVREQAASALGRIVRGQERGKPVFIVPPVPKPPPLPPRPQVKVDVEAGSQARLYVNTPFATAAGPR